MAPVAAAVSLQPWWEVEKQVPALRTSCPGGCPGARAPSVQAVALLPCLHTCFVSCQGDRCRL